MQKIIFRKWKDCKKTGKEKSEAPRKRGEKESEDPAAHFGKRRGCKGKRRKAAK